MKILGADISSLFTKFVYMLSEVFVFPFRNVLETYSFAGMEIELAVILAAIVYWMATVILVRFLKIKELTINCESPEQESGSEVVGKVVGKKEGAESLM